MEPVLNDLLVIAEAIVDWYDEDMREKIAAAYYEDFGLESAGVPLGYIFDKYAELHVRQYLEEEGTMSDMLEALSRAYTLSLAAQILAGTAPEPDYIF